MRIAFADLLFSWPPHGGSDVDLCHTIRGIQSLGHEVRLFAAKLETSRERAGFDPAQLPFPATRLDFTDRTMNRTEMPARFRQAVDSWQPQVVFAGFGYFLKPYLIEALAHYPIISRCYAYELICPRDFRLFKNGAPCPMNYLETPDVCRPCALESLAPEIKSWRLFTWARDYVAARAYMPAYYDRLIRSLRLCKTIIVYNRILQQRLDGFHNDVRVIPGGVNVADFPVAPPERRDRKIVLMTGRAEDPCKGFRILQEAADQLLCDRSDFEVWITDTDSSLNRPGFKAVGWKDPEATRALYAQADVCVVPSVWEEPFGIVAVEAMAAARPVCASRAGGLQDIVLHGETGLLFERGKSADLAQCLARLLDDPDLRQRMGQAGRARAEIEYDWDRIVARHYPALLEACAR